MYVPSINKILLQRCLPAISPFISAKAIASLKLNFHNSSSSSSKRHFSRGVGSVYSDNYLRKLDKEDDSDGDNDGEISISDDDMMVEDYGDIDGFGDDDSDGDDITSVDYDDVLPAINDRNINASNVSSKRKSYKFVDRVIIEVRGGKGGNGCISHEILTPGKKRPNGGNGGKGGDVYLVADRSLTSMTFETFHFNAIDGRHGGSDGLTGRCGRDLYVKVPVGTLVSLNNTYDSVGSDNIPASSKGYATEAELDAAIAREEENAKLNGYDDDNVDDYEVIDLDTDGTTVLIAKGGSAGIGNKVLGGSSTKKKSAPKTILPGGLGEHKSLLLELKLIADVGLVGFPNAGKSTLLNALSNAKPKIAAYPFTTLHPNVGVVEYSDLERITMADIPGLIDGASENRGLGHDFLRHIERTKILLYVLDAAGSDSHGDSKRSPENDLKSLRRELKLYDPILLTRPSLIFSNKNDLNINPESAKKLQQYASKIGLGIVYGSAEVGDGIGNLANQLRMMIEGNKDTKGSR